MRLPARIAGPLLTLAIALAVSLSAAGPPPTITIETPMVAPEWARLERRLLDDHVPACRDYFRKYYDARGFFRCFLRWGANDGPDDAFENFAGWPDLHALGADDEILRLFLLGWNGMIRQYSEAKTVDVPAGRDGMYFKEFSAQADWMHHGEGLRTFNLMGLSVPDLPVYQDRLRRFAGLYMGEDPGAPNYDPKLRLIRSMINGSKGPMLRKATALDWVGDPFDIAGFDAAHGESTYRQFLQHYEEYVDVVGDHFLNLVATTLPTGAYLLSNEARYREWVVGYVDAWLERMKRNGGILPSYVALDGKIGGPEGRWWGNAYGWGFSPVNPVTGKREDRNRIPRAIVGFGDALLLTGNMKYVDAWRSMADAVNANARVIAGRREYPTMYGPEGWYGWQNTPWNVGALEVWYWSQRPEDRARVGANAWIGFLEAKNPGYPELALRRDIESLRGKVDSFQRDDRPAEKRLADNVMDWNPASVTALEQLMWGALPPGRAGELLSARLRYFDPERKRAGIPRDVAALVTEMSDTHVAVTLVNLSSSEVRSLIVQAGAYGEHQIVDASWNGRKQTIQARDFELRLAPGAGARLALTLRRFANAPTVRFPWDR